MFEVNNGTAKIDGSKGKYYGKVTNPSVKYGRNAVENYYTYLEQPLVSDIVNPSPILPTEENVNNFIKKNNEYLDALPPLEFEYRYMPQGKLDKKALLGAAYEELGGNKEVGVKELDAVFAPNSTFTSEALDINKDGKIDVAEYGTSILAADMLSKSETPNFSNIDGTINKKGFDAVLAYAQKSKAAAAAALYSKIYNTYNLGEAQKEFKPE